LISQIILLRTLETTEKNLTDSFQLFFAR
jgi:hypothetical protein